MSSYRARIYADYAAAMQDATGTFDAAAASRWGAAYDHYFKGWLPRDKNAPIADLACGDGRLLYFLRERGYSSLTGVDISPPQIHLARQVVPSVIEASALDFIEAHPNCFQLIAGLDIVEHFTKDEVLRFLDGCRAALSPGGRLILQTPNADSSCASSLRYGDFTHEICFNPNSLGRLLKICGFDTPESREMGPPRGYSVSASLRGMVWSMQRWKSALLNRIETGTSGSGVFTRVFSISAVRK